MRLHPPLRGCWMRRGQQRLVDTPGQQAQIHYFGVYNWATDEVFGRCQERANSEGFCRFLDHLMTQVYPTDKIVLVMDNASFHTSAMSQAVLCLYQDRLQVIYLPGYCPFFNPIERFWQHLMQLVNVNRLHRSLDDLMQCLAFHLIQQNDLQYDGCFTFSKD